MDSGNPQTDVAPDPSELLGRLTGLYGIGTAYNDFRGRPVEVAAESRIAILAAMRVDAATPQSIATAVHAFETSSWMRMLPPAVVATVESAARIAISIPGDLSARTLQWIVTLEDGATRAGSATLDDLDIQATGEAEGRSFERRVLLLPADLPLGYHRVAISLDTGLSGDARLVVAPPKCHKAAVIGAGQRVWGIAVQLYALRSASNWGIGDFADLRELIALAAPLGCGLIGLNPLHALVPADPSHISPYSPSSRQFLNVLYIAVPDVPEYAECAAVRKQVESAPFQATLEKLREPLNVDYPAVARVKFAVLRELYEHFRTTHLDVASERGLAFQRYVEERGEPLRLHAVYDALDSLPKQRRRDPEAVEEAVRRSVRGQVNAAWGKKPICHVMVLQV